MICEKCNKEFNEDWRKDKDFIRKNPIPRFCSIQCANSRIFSKETNERKSESLKQWIKENPEKAKRHYSNNCIFLIKASRVWQEERQNFLFESDFNSISFDLKRKKILLEQNNKCAHCGLSEWMGKPIILEIDHKDGNNQNDGRENLEAICPNCHSLTPTWRGRNIKKIKISNEDLLNAFFETGNIRQCLIRVGLVPKGDNYRRVKKLIASLNIPVKNGE